jgi:NCAIR mutase (PurE)-related protein
MTADVTFDFERQRRIGLSEAVFCSGKTPEQIGEIIALARGRLSPLLLTRLAPDTVLALAEDDRAGLDYDPRSHTAILGPWRAPEGDPPVAVVTRSVVGVTSARGRASGSLRHRPGLDFAKRTTRHGRHELR